MTAGDYLVGVNFASEYNVHHPGDVITFDPAVDDRWAALVTAQWVTSIASDGITEPTEDSHYDWTDPTPMAAVAAVHADVFVDSIGVNIHANDFGSDTTNAYHGTAWETVLADLGVRHVRDTYCLSCTGQIGKLNTLTAAGYKVTMALAGNTVPLATMTGSVLPAFIASGLVTPYAVEGWNEKDLDSSNSNRYTDVGTFQPTLYSAVKGQWPSALVTGASMAVAANHASVGSLGSNIDVNNAHIYERVAQTPEYAPLYIDATNGTLYHTQGPGKPLWVTETGWVSGDPTDLTHVEISELAHARLAARTLIHCFAPVANTTIAQSPFNSPPGTYGRGGLGAAKTFLYELMDQHTPATDTTGQHRFGLYHYDGTPKQAATHLKNMIALLSDPGSTFTPSPLLATHDQGASSTFSWFVMQKRDGHYWIAFWKSNGVQTNQNAAPLPATQTLGDRTDNADTALNATFTFDRKFTAKQYRPLNGATVVSSAGASKTLAVDARFDVQLVELTPV
jgi:hypothetical protein